MTCRAAATADANALCRGVNRVENKAASISKSQTDCLRSPPAISAGVNDLLLCQQSQTQAEGIENTKKIEQERNLKTLITAEINRAVLQCKNQQI